MKRQLLVMSLLASFLFLGSLNWSACSAKKAVGDSAEKPTETTQPAEKPQMPAFMVALQEKVKGKEQMPAEEVFENIQILKGMPAGRVLPIMRMAFSQSLGVRCNHCHDMENFASEDKAAKQVARDMWVMTGKINRELLPSIKNLQSTQPVANCTTCHRGDIKPATSLPKQ